MRATGVGATARPVMQFLLSVMDDGTVFVTKSAGLLDPWSGNAPDFDAPTVRIGDVLDLHCKVRQETHDLDHARLLRITLEDDTIPRFESIEQAEAWMEERKTMAVMTR